MFNTPTNNHKHSIYIIYCIIANASNNLLESYINTSFNINVMSRKAQAAMEFLMFRTECSKPKNSKSAQAAMEFLMTYGWALLVVLITMAALALFGLLNPGKFLPERCEISVGLPCLTFTAETDGDNEFDVDDRVIIIMSNGIGKPISNFHIYIEKCFEQSSPISLSPGESGKIIATNCSMSENSRFSSRISVDYNSHVINSMLQQANRGYINVDVAEAATECDKLYDPVCGLDNVSYINECHLEKRGAEKAHDGNC